MSENMFDIVSATTGNTIIPEGAYDGVLYAIIQNGTQKRPPYKGAEKEPANMIKFMFEIPELKVKDSDTMSIGKEVPSIVSERSNFFKILKNIGAIKSPDMAEVGKLFKNKKSLETILGTGVTINIGHFDKQDGSKGHFIESVSKLDPRLPQPEGTKDTFIFCFNEPDLDVFKNKLTKWGRKRVMHALNADKLPKEFHEYYISEQEQNSGDVDII